MSTQITKKNSRTKLCQDENGTNQSNVPSSVNENSKVSKKDKNLNEDELTNNDDDDDDIDPYEIPFETFIVLCTE